MNTLLNFYQRRLIAHSITPYKVRRLESGAIMEYYKNGTRKIKACSKYIPQTCGDYIATSFIDICPTCNKGV